MENRLKLSFSYRQIPSLAVPLLEPEELYVQGAIYKKFKWSYSLILFSAFLLYTLQVAMNFAMMSALYGDFMQVCSSVNFFNSLLPNLVIPVNLQELTMQCFNWRINIAALRLRNRLALAVNCWGINHSLEDSCKVDYITRVKLEWYIYL